ncbi:MAG: transporter, partial [Pseudomonadota bacterium]
MLLLPSQVPAAGTLREAIERAWERQPAAQARPARAEEFTAKQEAARAAFPEPPSLSVGNRNDRITGNDGLLEWETEIALPLWLPGEQGRQNAIVNAERDQYDTGLTAAKLKIAGEVRDAYWQARLAENE